MTNTTNTGAPVLSDDQRIEAVAEIIFVLMAEEAGVNRPWEPGGNSHKQYKARAVAREVLAAASPAQNYPVAGKGILPKAKDLIHLMRTAAATLPGDLDEERIQLTSMQFGWVFGRVCALHDFYLQPKNNADVIARIQRYEVRPGIGTDGDQYNTYGHEEPSGEWVKFNDITTLLSALPASPAPVTASQPEAWGKCVWCDAPSTTKNRSCSAPDGDGHMFKATPINAPASGGEALSNKQILKIADAYNCGCDASGYQLFADCHLTAFVRAILAATKSGSVTAPAAPCGGRIKQRIVSRRDRIIVWECEKCGTSDSNWMDKSNMICRATIPATEPVKAEAAQAGIDNKLQDLLKRYFVADGDFGHELRQEINAHIDAHIAAARQEGRITAIREYAGLLEENNRLAATQSGGAAEDALIALLPGTYYMDPPDGGSVTLIEQLQRMAEDAARYRWLLDNYAFGDGYTKIDAALNEGEADKYLSAAIDAARAALNQEGGAA